jgi:hypothetical protein
LRRDTERNAKNQCVGNNRDDKYKVDAGINDVEGGSAQSRSRYQRLGEQRGQRGLRLALDLNLKAKNERTGRGAHEDHETRGRGRNSRTDAPHQELDGEFMHSRPCTH